jgi:KRAB domain-containing zinc finger protein
LYRGSHGCDLCNFSTFKASQLVLHNRQKHGQDTNSSASDFSIQSLTRCNSSSIKWLKCESCYDRQFETVEGLTAHRRKVHSGPDLLTCPRACPYTTHKRKLLQLHVKRSHLAAEKGNNSTAAAHSCHICCRSYRTLDSYKAHLKCHDGSVDIDQSTILFRCVTPGCDFSSKFKSDLDRHSVKHSFDKPLACGQCDFTCKRKSELTRHERLVHSDMPETACGQCAYRTRNMFHLKRHVRLKHEKCPAASKSSAGSNKNVPNAAFLATVLSSNGAKILTEAPDYTLEFVVL